MSYIRNVLWEEASMAKAGSRITLTWDQLMHPLGALPKMPEQFWLFCIDLEHCDRCVSPSDGHCIGFCLLAEANNVLEIVLFKHKDLVVFVRIKVNGS